MESSSSTIASQMCVGFIHIDFLLLQAADVSPVSCKGLRFAQCIKHKAETLGYSRHKVAPLPRLYNIIYYVVFE